MLGIESRTSVLIDPDSYDPTEEQFAASVYEDEQAETAPPAPAETRAGESPAPPPEAATEFVADVRPVRETTLTGIERLAQEVISNADLAGHFVGDGWRDEVHSRLNNYRARRRRVPEGAMPLDFGGEEPAPAPVTRRSAAVQRVASRYANRPPMMSELELQEPADPPVESNIIEFPKPPEPRTFEFERTAPLPLSDELAEAVQESPRILEAAPIEELPPVMPSVTDITLEGEEEELAAAPALPGLELPLRVAPIAQRIFAAMVDFSAVVVGSAVFALVFVKIAGGMPESKLAPVVGAGVVALLWAMYQYMFLVYAGTTPGLQVSGLALRDFSGERLRGIARRNRAFGMMVAALPLGLGFLWAMLDEDALCWHDRMSHSYVVERGH